MENEKKKYSVGKVEWTMRVKELKRHRDQMQNMTISFRMDIYDAMLNCDGEKTYWIYYTCTA